MKLQKTTGAHLWFRFIGEPVALVATLVLFFQAGAVYAQNLVQNGAFSANAAAFTNYPGYSGGSNPASIANWSATLGLNMGVNGMAVGFAGSPFGPTSAGNNTYAFIQRVTSYTNGLTQNLTLALAANTLYQLSFDAAARSGNTAQFQVRVGDTNQACFDSGSVAGNATAFLSILGENRQF